MVVETVCDNCGEIIFKKPVHFRNYKTHFCNQECMIKYRRKNADYRRKTARLMRKNWSNPEFVKMMTEERRGRNNPNWRGGKWKKKNSFFNKVRNLQKYIDWKNAVLKRDVKTYPKIPRNLQVHHIKSLKRIIYENNIETIKQAEECKELWDINNGCVLTSGEHLIVTWLNRKKKISRVFLDYLKFFVEEYNHNFYSWCRIDEVEGLTVE